MPGTMAFQSTRLSIEIWIRILFDIDDNPTRGAFRALSPWHESIGETARQVIETRVRMTEANYNESCGSWTAAFNRLSFWTPWVGTRNIPGVYPEHMNSHPEIRHQSFARGRWLDRWYIYYYGLHRPLPARERTQV